MFTQCLKYQTTLVTKYLLFQEDARQDAVDALYNDALNRQMQLNVEYKANGIEYVTLLEDEAEGKGKDTGLSLLSGGYVVLDARKEKRLAKLMSDYKAAQEKAKKDRVSFLFL